MTGLTKIGGADVRCTHTTGRCAIVTTDAIGGDTSMVYGGSQPLRSDMTRVAFLRSRYMCGV